MSRGIGAKQKRILEIIRLKDVAGHGMTVQELMWAEWRSKDRGIMEIYSWAYCRALQSLMKRGLVKRSLGSAYTNREMKYPAFNQRYRYSLSVARIESTLKNGESLGIRI